MDLWEFCNFTVALRNVSLIKLAVYEFDLVVQISELPMT